MTLIKKHRERKIASLFVKENKENSEVNEVLHALARIGRTQFKRYSSTRPCIRLTPDEASLFRKIIVIARQTNNLVNVGLCMIKSEHNGKPCWLLGRCERIHDNILFEHRATMRGFFKNRWLERFIRELEKVA